MSELRGGKVFKVFYSLIIVTAVLGAWALGAAGDTIESVIASPELRGAVMSFVVWDLDSGEVLYERNPDRMMTPASNMKLVTAGAALIKLGTEFQFHTDFYVSGWNAQTGAARDLYVLGGGDPSFSEYFFDSGGAAADEIASQLARYGLRSVSGSIFLDDSLFSGGEYPAGWASDDANYCYGMRAGALSIAENCIRVKVTGGAKAGAAAVVNVDPALAPGMSSISVATVKKGGSVKISQDATGFVKISGSVSPGGSIENEYPVPKPALLFGNALAGAMQRQKISFKGKLAHSRTGSAPDGFVKLASVGSPYLNNILGVMLKKSDNFIAETMLRTMGVEQGGSIPSGTKAAMATMKKYGISTGDNLAMFDGSGLSRNNKLAPRVLMSLLKAFYNSYLKTGMTAMMAEPGGDGTLKKRLVGTPAQGRVWAKTGAIRGACSLSGLFKRSNGDMAAFSMIMNNYTVHSNLIRAIQDRLVLLMIDL